MCQNRFPEPSAAALPTYLKREMNIWPVTEPAEPWGRSPFSNAPQWEQVDRIKFSS